MGMGGAILLYIGVVCISLFILHEIIVSAVKTGINKSILNKENHVSDTENEQPFLGKDLDD